MKKRLHRPSICDKSIIGKTFGDFTILKIGKRKYNYTTVKICFVKCICGNKKWIPFQAVKSGKYLNCGRRGCHWAVKGMIGKKFGRLTVLSYHSRYIGYNCKCECGNFTKAKGWALKSGNHKSCGCYMIDALIKRQTKPNFFAFKIFIFRNYKASAKRKGYTFTLSRKLFFKLLMGNCTYCNIPPCSRFNRKKGVFNDFRYNGIDRVDNSKGYTKENCVSCCHICNDSKKNLHINDWRNWIQRIYKHQFKK